MKNLGLLIGSLAFTLIAVIGIAVLFSQKANVPAAAVDQNVLMNNTVHSKGKSGAAVTIVEFSDFQCPSCKAVQPLIAAIETQQKEKVRFIYRHFPLRSIHKNAFTAAKAAEAASMQGKFWEYHDKLFETQQTWESEKDPTSLFVSYAKELGLKEDQFKTDLASKEIEKKITTDESDAVTLSVNATPTFYVNGAQVDVNKLQETVANVLAK